MTATVRVELPAALRALANTGPEVLVHVDGRITQRTLLDGLEASFPMLRGTIRDHTTLRRRPYIRFFACEQDLSHCPPDQKLPAPVIEGHAPFLIIGAIAGG